MTRSCLEQAQAVKVKPMKAAVTVLLLLLQLGPLAGTAMCLHASGTTTECGMPAHPAGSLAPVGDSHASHGGACTGAVVCSPAALAVLPAERQLEFALPQHPVALPGARSLVTGPPAAPPFHPPRT
jgi:hypothetical protein